MNAFGHRGHVNLLSTRSIRWIVPTASITLTNVWQTFRKWCLCSGLVSNTALHPVHLYVDGISTFGGCSEFSYCGRRPMMVEIWGWEICLKCSPWRKLPNLDVFSPNWNKCAQCIQDIILRLMISISQNTDDGSCINKHNGKENIFWYFKKFQSCT